MGAWLQQQQPKEKLHDERSSGGSKLPGGIAAQRNLASDFRGLTIAGGPHPLHRLSGGGGAGGGSEHGGAAAQLALQQHIQLQEAQLLLSSGGGGGSQLDAAVRRLTAGRFSTSAAVLPKILP